MFKTTSTKLSTKLNKEWKVNGSTMYRLENKMLLWCGHVKEWVDIDFYNLKKEKVKLSLDISRIPHLLNDWV
jgi:hypothetical protein